MSIDEKDAKLVVLLTYLDVSAEQRETIPIAYHMLPGLEASDVAGRGEAGREGISVSLQRALSGPDRLLLQKCIGHKIRSIEGRQNCTIWIR